MGILYIYICSRLIKIYKWVKEIFLIILGIIILISFLVFDIWCIENRRMNGNFNFIKFEYICILFLFDVLGIY